eukprot:CAMPEP_0174294924 /NCGR_PEP_ID=MMETSP0809-20121228/43030_1 /TAXON_ID=73025 ORGANISM="Eutreptiella gymnastica-like, Strain CCMP1594" /NCGR_SAMPLE_ID=MMETSP0809 /ASSEMBLY_ACC=CAM_ASM_000658 /LENGTH=566 /DNA_ID=CAMNT_0015396729 /DNA_START=39 /DNA_END=1739 /DNA_ORIENTATION=+
MTRFFLVSLILLIFILRVSAAKKELTDPQNELQHKKAEIKKSDPQIELQYKKEEMKRFGLLVEEHVDGTVSRIRLKNDFERDSDYELQGGKYIYWIAPEAMDKKLETEEKAEINKKAAPAAPNKKTKKAPDVPDKGLSDGVHVEIPWCGLEENPMDNCDPQSRKVKKVGIAVVKDIKDAYKLTGEKLHIPRGATGSVVHFRRWDAQGKPVKGPIRMKLRGIEHFPGIYRFPDNEGDAESEGKLLLADDEKNKVEPCVDEDGNKEMGCLVIESQGSSSFAALIFENDVPCPLDLLIVSAQPSTLAPDEFAEVKKYMRARVNSFLTRHPGYFIGIEQYHNGALIACPLTNDKQLLFACIDGTPYNTAVIEGTVLGVGQGQGSEYIATASAMSLAGRHLLSWWRVQGEAAGRSIPEFAVELVLPGPSRDQQGYYSDDPFLLWMTYTATPPNYGIKRMLAVNYKTTPLIELDQFPAKGMLQHTYVVHPVADLERCGAEEIRFCPADYDCVVGDGKEVTFSCPYESVIMEHCYKCVHDIDHEVVICDGWTEEDIRAQCESPVPIASPSPVI